MNLISANGTGILARNASFSFVKVAFEFTVLKALVIQTLNL